MVERNERASADERLFVSVFLCLRRLDGDLDRPRCPVSSSASAAASARTREAISASEPRATAMNPPAAKDSRKRLGTDDDEEEDDHQAGVDPVFKRLIEREERAELD